eukprot:4635-Heterococcus_DN1.PRE.5
MSSAYSLAQLVGGLLLGAASDRSRRGVLLLSFFGSAIGYFLIGTARSFTVLLCSRVVVGLVKQTLTVCTALISENLDADKPGGRARELGHLSACATGSFVIGPVLGSLLYKQHRLLPPIVSASLFLLNSVLVLVLLPSSKAAAAANTAAAAAAASMNAADTAKLAASQNGSSSSSSNSSSSKSVKSIKERMYNLQSNLKGSCALRPCFVVVVAKLFNGFLMRSMDSSLIVGYFEDTWKVETHVLGYVRSYSTLFMLFAQVYLVGRLAKRTSESTLVTLAMSGIAVALALEASGISFNSYLAVALPLRLLAQGLVQTCLQSLFTRRVPQHELGAALGSIGILQSALGVMAPLYGGALFQRLGTRNRAVIAACHCAVYACCFAAGEKWATSCESETAKAVTVNSEIVNEVTPQAVEESSSGSNGTTAVHSVSSTELKKEL